MQAQKIIPVAVIGLLLAAAALTLVSGIYPDEVAYKIFLERYFITGGFKEGVTPFCAGSFLVAPPAILVPAAALWAQLTWLGSSWFSYRLVPYASLLIVMLVLIRHNLQKGNRSFWPLLLFVTLGALPFAITLLRPEAILLACCMILFLIGSRMLVERRILYLYLYGFAALLLYSVAVYVHPKAVYLIVVPAISVTMAASRIASRTRRYAYGAVFLGGLALIALAAISLHQKQFLVCDALPDLQGSMGAQSANPMDIFLAPRRFIANLHMALGAHPLTNLYSQIVYRRKYEADFLPGIALSSYDRIADLFIIMTMAGFAVYVAVKSLLCLFRPKNPEERREFYLIVSVIVALSVPYTLSIVKHFYEIALFSWTIMIAAALLWPLNPRQGAIRRPATLLGISAALMALSLACIVLSYENFVLPLRSGFRGPDVPAFVDRKALDRTIGQMLANAHIAATEPLIVSDLTYEAVKYRPYLVPITYMSPAFHKPGLTRSYMEKLGIRHGMVECGILPPEKEFPARLMTTRRFTQTLDGGKNMTFDLCLFRLQY